MTTVAVYPRLGTEYDDANGVPITAAGAIVDVSKYILDALRKGFLLDWDPLDVFEPDDRTGIPAGGDGMPAFESVSLLAARVGTSDGQAAVTNGYATAGDGGGGQWYWDAASVEASDDALICGAGTGRWKRQYSGAVNARWFGAVGSGLVDDSAAIQAALDTDANVFVPAGTYRLDSQLVLSAGQTISGEGRATRFNVNASYGFKVQDVQNVAFRDVYIVCGAGRSGVEIRASVSGFTMYTLFERVSILVSSSGTSVGLDFITDDPTSGNCNYFARVVESDIAASSPGSSTTSTGIRIRGPSASMARCVGLRVLDTRFTNMHVGIDADNTDTGVVSGCAFDGIVQSGAANPANSGRAIVLGAYTNQWELRANRFEDCDVYYENLGIAQRLDSAFGFPAGTILNTGDGDSLVSGYSDAASVNAQNTNYTRHARFQSSVGLSYNEPKTAVGGTTLYSLADNSGVMTPMVRIIGPASAFSLGSIKVHTTPMVPSGTIKYVYNTTSQSMTIKHEDAGGVAAERIATLTGADVVVPGPSVCKFIYDTSVAGNYGDQRWVYMGSG